MASANPSGLKIAVISLGSMGAGIAHLLTSHGYQVVSNCTGRSQDTLTRAKRVKAELVTSDAELVQQCRLILSVVPPQEATSTAQRVVDAISGNDSIKEDVYYADLNAVSPSTCNTVATLVSKARLPLKFIDGCILGGPPHPKVAETQTSNAEAEKNAESSWYRPRIPISGPHDFSSLPGGKDLTSLLNAEHISPKIGAASGLKMCFAAINKGLVAIATQSLSTAHNLGVLDNLQSEMQQVMPGLLDHLSGQVVGMPPKAYRWIKEMEEIRDTFAEEGKWSKNLFEGVADVYRAVAQDDILGKETPENRKRGKDLDDLAACTAESLRKRQKKDQ